MCFIQRARCSPPSAPYTYICISSLSLRTSSGARIKRKPNVELVCLVHLLSNFLSFFWGIGTDWQTTYSFPGTEGASNDDSEEGKRNNILQKAILLYIGHVSCRRWYRGNE